MTVRRQSRRMNDDYIETRFINPFYLKYVCVCVCVCVWKHVCFKLEVGTFFGVISVLKIIIIKNSST